LEISRFESVCKLNPFVSWANFGQKLKIWTNFRTKLVIPDERLMPFRTKIFVGCLFLSETRLTLQYGGWSWTTV